MSMVIDAALGIDLGDRTSRYVVYGHGTVLGRGKVRMEPGAFKEEFGSVRYKIAVIEAGAQSQWVYAELTKCGQNVVVANPRKVQLISQNERKSDERDPLLLAKLGNADPSLLHPVVMRAEEHVAAMHVLRSRDAAVRVRTSLINSIKAQVKAAGYRLTAGSRASLRERTEKLPEGLRHAVLGLVSIVEGVSEQIKGYDRQLQAMAKAMFPDVSLLTQVDGVGVVTGLALFLLVGDPTRFKSARDVAAYIGLVPRRRESGADPQLRISKTGNGFVRRLLVQCAQYILARGEDCDLRRWGLALCERGGKNGKKRAVIAVARKLAVQLVTLWRRRLEWDPFHHSRLLAACEASPTTGDAPSGAPRSLVSDDCAAPLEPPSGDARGRDCSVTDSSDPNMRSGTKSPAKNADRSVDTGASRSSIKKDEVSPNATKSGQAKAPRRNTPLQRPPRATVEAPQARRQTPSGAGTPPPSPRGSTAAPTPPARPRAPMEAPPGRRAQAPGQSGRKRPENAGASAAKKK